MKHAQSRVETLLLLRLQRGGARAVMVAFGDEGGGIGIFFGDRFGERMIGRDGEEACAEQRVGARGEHLDQVMIFGDRATFDRETDKKSLRAPDPVRLHQTDLLRPVLQAVESLKQILRVVGDLEHPLRLLALLDQSAGAPATPVDHLLIGEHGLIDGVPIDFAGLAVDETRFQEIEEQALLLMVVIEVASGELARPIERQTQALELVAHDGDVVVGRFGGMAAAFDGRVLGRQTESIPTHGMQHVVALGAHIAGDDVAHGVVAHMPHMDAARGVGEHFKNVIFRTRIILEGAEDAALLPGCLPMLLPFQRVVAFRRHGPCPFCLGACGMNKNGESGQVTLCREPC